MDLFLSEVNEFIWADMASFICFTADRKYSLHLNSIFSAGNPKIYISNPTFTQEQNHCESSESFTVGQKQRVFSVTKRNYVSSALCSALRGDWLQL